MMLGMVCSYILISRLVVPTGETKSECESKETFNEQFTSRTSRFFTNSRQYRNANIANFIYILAVSLEINNIGKDCNLEI